MKGMPTVGGSTGEIPIPRAVIVVPKDEDSDQWVRFCMSWCEEEGIPVARVIVGRGWRAAVEMTLDGRAEIVVVAKNDHLSPDRVPQLRVVEVERAKKAESRRRRRPGWRRRPEIIDR